MVVVVVVGVEAAFFINNCSRQHGESYECSNNVGCRWMTKIGIYNNVNLRS